jgi:NAD(P)-dependent dehydrogenase (short-subunit alcohol dehydrogenase family)
MNASAAPVMLITGGSGSIGSEIAALAAEAGWSVAIHGRRAEAIEKAVEAVASRAPDAAISGHVADFGEAGAIERLVAETVEEHGRIDAVVDCAVGGPPGITGRFPETDPEAYTGLAAQSIVALQRLAHAALPLLSRQGGTLIAFISDAGIFAAPNQTMIGAMRAASIGFVRNLAMEVARDKVRVHAVSPSYVEETRIAHQIEAVSAKRMETARARAGLGLPTPADIAPLVLFLCGPGAAHITGQVISINGGLNA